MASSLDSFPDLCLIAIFINLPLSDLLAVIGLVCGRWRRLLSTVLARRHSLNIVQTDSVVNKFEPGHLYGGELIYKVLRDGSPWLVQSKVDTRNVVVVPNVVSARILTEPFTNGLMHSLPNITSLTVIQRDVNGNLLPEVLTQITRMLDCWQDSLVSLTLSVKCIFAHPKESLITNLFESLNRLGSLRHLKIDFDFPWMKYEPELRIFSQLNTLVFSAQFNQQNWLIRCINQYANPNVITQISTDAYFDMDKCLQFTPKLAAKFYQVGRFRIIVDRNNPGDVAIVGTFCHRFTSVRYLSLLLTSDSLQTVIPNLAPLQHLIHLKLQLISSYFILHELAPIRSVRMLTISLPTQSHQQLESYRLPELFPNVQILQMTHHTYDCRDCDFGGVWNTIKDRLIPKIHECKRLARQALTRFPNLHTIKLEQFPGTSDGTFTHSDTIDSLEQL